MIEQALKILRSDRPLPVDLYALLIEEGIDVQYLINLQSLEDSNDTNETCLSHWES